MGYFQKVVQIMYFPSHYKKHKAVELTKPYLNGQSIGVLNDMPYGFRTVGNVGCGPLALYNAMRYKGLEPDLPKIKGPKVIAPPPHDEPPQEEQAPQLPEEPAENTQQKSDGQE